MKATSAHFTVGYKKTALTKAERPETSLVENLLESVRKQMSILKESQLEPSDTFEIFIAGDGWEVTFSSEQL